MPARLLLLVAFLVLAKITKPQSVSTLMGARSNAMANASSTLQDEWALFNNIGGLSKATRPTIGATYSVNPSLPGSNRMACAFSSPIGIGAMGFGVFKFGDEIYSEQILTGGYSNKFGLASLGIKLNYVQYRAEGFGTKTALSINFGGIAEITDKVFVGAHIINLNQPKLSSDVEERLNAILSAGIRYMPESHVSIVMEIEKDVEFDPTIKGALEYRFYKKFDLRTGFNLYPNAFFGGVGFTGHRLKVDYAMQFTQYLQTQFQLSTSFMFATKS